MTSENEQNAISVSKISNFNAHHLQLYYDRIFPFHLLFEWLTYSRGGDPNSFLCREFSMSVDRGEDEFYMRWLSFNNGDHFKRKLLSMSPPPHKIDIGAIYNLPVSQKDSSTAFIPLEKEIVLDIDMNDYDEIRTCCKNKKVCSKCWKFLSIAMNILENVLREDFGYCHIFWVFSGRRGIHCWICDASARKASSEFRGALADYLNVVTASSNQKKKVRFFGDDVYPMARLAHDRNLNLYRSLLEEQDFFRRGTELETLVNAYIEECKLHKKNDMTIQEAYELKKRNHWDGTSLGLWNIITKLCRDFNDKVTEIELFLTFCYPRLDIHVTKDIGHLLKAPFCVHKATGCICVPLSADQRMNFDPSKAPTLSGIREQYLEHKEVGKTDLGPYIHYFKTDVLEALLRHNESLISNMETNTNETKSSEVIMIEEWINDHVSIEAVDKPVCSPSLDW